MNGKVYIGSAVDLKNRWNKHRYTLDNNIHRNRHLQNAWDKYGEEYFEFVVIEYCEIEVLIEREQFYLDLMKPDYNIRLIADSNLGIKLSEETINKLKARTHSQEARNKISLARKGCIANNRNKIFSDEDIKFIRASKDTLRKLATEYNSNEKTIANIKKHKIYKEMG